MIATSEAGRARLVDLPEFGETERGTLAVASCGAQVPFTVRRTFMIYDVPDDVVRGGHAHRHCQQFLLCMAGAADLLTEDAAGAGSYRLGKPNQGLYVPALTWLSIKPASPETVVLVLASDAFDEADYIRDRAAFEALVAESRP